VAPVPEAFLLISPPQALTSPRVEGFKTNKSPHRELLKRLFGKCLAARQRKHHVH
jgi:hypothetical protein